VKLTQINLFVEDFPACLAFYRDVLALDPIDVDPGPPAKPLVSWASFLAGNIILELFDAKEYCRDVDGGSRDQIELALYVDDVDQERSRLEALGVECEPVHEEKWGRYSLFRDPAGNRLQLHQVFDTWDEA
jgi:catechol 2,3-dioxygenase-like lactoylglutathione lyase family enzyme